jgi:hypothetical protein
MSNLQAKFQMMEVQYKYVSEALASGQNGPEQKDIQKGQEALESSQT